MDKGSAAHGIRVFESPHTEKDGHVRHALPLESVYSI